MRSSAGCTSGCAVETDGASSFRIAPKRLAWLLPMNARRPVSISKRMQPNAQMSARASASSPSTISGAMYVNVPRIVPCIVSGVVMVAGDVIDVIIGAAGVLAVPAPATIFARPKSRSLTPAGVSITLPGFRSRWRMPWRCAACSALAI